MKYLADTEEDYGTCKFWGQEGYWIYNLRSIARNLPKPTPSVESLLSLLLSNPGITLSLPCFRSDHTFVALSLLSFDQITLLWPPD